MVIGIIEFGMYFLNSTSASTAVAAGARTAVTQARVDGYQTTVADAVKAAMKDVSATPELLTIYKADSDTGEPTGGIIAGNFNSCLAECYKFVWNASSKSWTQLVGPGQPEWPASAQAACGPAGHNDYLGVQLSLRYRSATGFVLDNKQVTATSMMRLEPVSAAAGQECES